MGCGPQHTPGHNPYNCFLCGVSLQDCFKFDFTNINTDIFLLSTFKANLTDFCRKMLTKDLSLTLYLGDVSPSGEQSSCPVCDQESRAI